MFKNRAGQKLTMLAVDATGNTPKTGDAANITLFQRKDGGALTPLADAALTEISATNAAGLYEADPVIGETNADYILFTGKSSTPGVVIVPKEVYTSSNKSGAGADEVTVRVLVAGNPISGADVWITDTLGTVVAGMDVSDALGRCTFMLDAGDTYLLWAQKPGVTSIRGDEFVAVAD